MISDEKLIEFCREAIQTPSYSGREKEAVEVMKKHMEEFGFDEVSIDRYGSLLGKIKGKRPGKTILMDGHIDTVDVIDEDKWNHKPFAAEIVDGKIYGRGTSDMKGSDVAMITAAGRFAEETKKNFAGEICVSCTVHEECFEGVSSREITKACNPDFVIIGEATSGTGKTTLARVIANTTKSHFSTLNAVLSGVKELREEIENAKERLQLYGHRTILFVDEVHRWNKSQQDALLPWVENGTFILIGATTENPFFEVNAALVSRSRIFQLKQLTSDDLIKIAKQALADRERGYGNLNVSFEEGALEHLVDVASGDARSLLNALELAVETSEKNENQVYISKQAAEESIQRKAVLYDKEGDYHFDVISAFIKSLRGSDPDAALYWLAKMVYAGEDPRFIFRRMMISACEDVGLADPNAIVVVQSDAAAFEMIGMPEGRYHLTHACLYLATAPKSNSALGFFDALSSVENEPKAQEVPNHLRDASRDSKGFAHGQGYMYPHSYREHWVAQQYLPDSLQGKIYYNPTDIGYEAKIKDLILKRREIQLESVDINAFPENLTYSPEDAEKDLWIRRTSFVRSQALNQIRNLVFSKTNIIRSNRILVLNAGHGLFVWEALRQTPEGLVVAQVNSTEGLQYINHYADELKDIDKPQIVKNISQIDENIRFENILGRNLTLSDTDFTVIRPKLTENGSFVTCETILSEASRLSDFVNEPETKQLLIAAEAKIYTRTKKDVLNVIADSFTITETEEFPFSEDRTATTEDINRWLEKSYLPNVNIPENEKTFLIKKVSEEIANKVLKWKTSCIIIKGKAN